MVVWGGRASRLLYVPMDSKCEFGSQYDYLLPFSARLLISFNVCESPQPPVEDGKRGFS